MKLFDLDGPFQRYGTIVFDLIVLNLFWLMISMLSFGLLQGVALTGLYSGVYAGIVTSEGYSFKQFFARMKQRFLPSLIAGIVSTLLTILSIANLYLTLVANVNLIGFIPNVVLIPIYVFIFLEISFVTTFIFPVIAHTDLSLKESLKAAFYLAHKHLPTTVLTTVLNGIMVLVVVFIALGAVGLFPLLLFGMGIVASMNSYFISKRILFKYETFIGTSV
ncbi:MAG: hypothetical protein JW708_01085 [Vallitaleaceae bacterium]|nr:hypothetical protein [Vallitaleaceae bacterium]